MARLLIIDDDIAVQTTLKHLLELEGHAADVVSDGNEAVLKIKETAYDLVILDRWMPIMTGIDVLHVLRATPKYKNLPILMLTSASVTKEIDDAFEAGANDYILKPLNIDHFIAKVRATLKNPRAR